MTNKFSQVPKAEIPRSSFDRSHGHKTTIDETYLYPIFIDEALPGDTFNLKMHAVARLATPIFPIMDNIYLDTFFFAVPYRLLWDNWERFNGAQDNPNSSIDFTIPQVNGEVNGGELGDYFALPTEVAGLSVSALPFRAYYLIWNEWFRDQNLQNSLPVITTDASQSFAEYTLQPRGKRHDYFTSCLPWPQKGAGSEVPITGAGNTPTFQSTALGGLADARTLMTSMGTRDAIYSAGSGGSATGDSSVRWADAQLDFTINTLRQAYQIQRLLERDARGGTRYTEMIKAHFGVTSPDARLQRPEYLGGFSQPMNISQIHQTQATSSGVTPLGQVGAIGTAHLDGNRNGFTTSFTEHCVVIGLVNLRAELTYQQQVNRMWSRRTRYDHYWPAFAHIGEQAVLKKEIYFSGIPATDDAVFGYQERYGEYRYKPSQVTGLFRSTSAAPLDAWHLALDFAATPVLNDTFVVDAPPISRVVAVPTEPKVILDCWFEFNCARPMPMFGVPGMSDHF